MSNKPRTEPRLDQQIAILRHHRGWTLKMLAKRAGTSISALHRYEHGWDRFELGTLRRIAAALGARLEVRLAPAPPPKVKRRPSAKALAKALAPLFCERDLQATDLSRRRYWILERVLTDGDHNQVRLARAFYGDEALRRAVERRGVDPETRKYWRFILGEVD